MHLAVPCGCCKSERGDHSSPGRRPHPPVQRQQLRCRPGELQADPAPRLWDPAGAEPWFGDLQ